MRLIFNNAWKFLRFTIGGLGLFFLRLGIVSGLTELLGLFYAYSYALALTTVIITGYFYNAHIAYRSDNISKKSFGKYVISILGFYAIDYALVLVLVEFISLHYVLAITLVTPTLFISKFYVYEKIFFPKSS